MLTSVTPRPGRQIAIAAGIWLLSVVAAARALAVEIDTLHQLDLEVKRALQEKRISLKTKSLWLQALSRDEVDLKREAALTIGLAHQRGFPDMKDTAPLLVSMLDAPETDRLVRLAAARTLIVLDARESADALMRQLLKSDLEMSQVAEPALAKWGYAAMTPIWLERINDGRATGRLLELAIRSAAAIRLTDAAPRLRELVLNPDLSSPVRMESARALGVIQPKGLEEAARHLLGKNSRPQLVDRLLAASLLAQHSGAESETILMQLAVDAEPAVAAIALQRLLEIDARIVEPVNAQILASRDPKVRSLGIEILTAQKTLAATRMLTAVLDDPNPKVRELAQNSLIALGEIEALSPSVQESVLQALGSSSPRALERAVIVAACIQQKSAVPRLLELLDHSSSDVAVFTAWAFRKIQDPDSVGPLVQKILAESQRIQSAIQKIQTAPAEKPAASDPNADAENAALAIRLKQFSHLIEAFGLLKSHEAEPLLLSLAESNRMFQNQSVWALGRIYENNPQPEMVAKFRKFIESGPPLRRAIAAAGLARMQAKDSVELLRGQYTPGAKFTIKERVDEIVDADVFKYACAAAVAKLTGEPIAEFEIPTRSHGARSDWFLESSDSDP